MSWKKSMFVYAAVLALVVGSIPFIVMVVKDRTYVPSPVYAPAGESNRAVAVVYYSRSGHSEAVAREIAQTFNAPIARIYAEYTLDMAGQRNAVSDASKEILPKIVVESIGLAPVKRIFLVAPTWMFRPATPLWAYVEQTDLTGKQVVLVTTGNSRFKQEETDAFAARVAAHGGHLVHHIFLRRGRIYWQKSREELIEDVRDQIREYQHATSL
ncbi:flavodoxin/nitric oxide synthase [Pectobacterium sp. FL60-S17]|uniref:Flavodoxin/nitric oxide synthase n=1 Tax=Dickeya zeae (strain Ech586) TaxID=590409 RepID=D2C3B2_DICZ5|nr:MULTISPECIES: flavodoxin/nitric oxide synthase [Pectobacteriaceae]ACZ77493.1 flavodoxin/nitric oxide synthase [Dickeya parazeae Ech586]MBE5202778.1 flavodoxin/nitric oxide synthase [Pectobacterium quasiaquaticum]MBE5210938.1 flavodoxin/nitric oxide synthase [Pectobacterium quasiaquaticum]MBE5221278.1 flavodoxin/nitric oxide synthase [Pectobacterium quasiaquaticum]